jgi:hypothetical protein
MTETDRGKQVQDIFNLESLYRVQRDSPTVSHMFCLHDDGICVQDGVTEWHQPSLPEEWVLTFQNNLFISLDGKDLWKKLMDSGFDAGDIIDSIALGVGDARSDEEAATNQSQARLLKEFLVKTRRTMSKIKDQLEAVKAERDGPVFVPSPEWPSEMEEFDLSLSKTLDTITRLIRHYKPMSHASRNLDTHEAFMVSVQHLRRSFQLSDGDIATLLSAGYQVSSKESITPQEVRERLASAQALYSAKPE